MAHLREHLVHHHGYVAGALDDVDDAELMRSHTYAHARGDSHPYVPYEPLEWGIPAQKEEIPQPIDNPPDPGGTWQEVDRMLGGLREDWVCVRYACFYPRFERHMRPIQEEIKLVLVRRDLYEAGYRGDWANE